MCVEPHPLGALSSSYVCLHSKCSTPDHELPGQFFRIKHGTLQYLEC